jgi:chorismate synthase
VAQILSGVFEGKTTGTPISILIPNWSADSSKYDQMKHLLRPGHANYTYLEKYGIFDHRGGGRASGRETACRVAAGAIGEKLLTHFGISCCAYLAQVGDITVDPDLSYLGNSAFFCPDPLAEGRIRDKILEAKQSGDSLGGTINFMALGLPVGLGDPVYEKLEANLAKAMLSIPATKGFEIGSGFASVSMTGSSHNDAFLHEGGKVVTKTNHAGGVLGGISTGMPLVGSVAFKPTSSIYKPQETLSLEKERSTFYLPEGSKHDPCLAIRAVPVVQAMLSLVLADALLLNRSARL